MERSRESAERSLRMKSMQDMASAVAKRLRDGKVDGETAKLAREALDGLSAAGRRFDQTDRDKMAKTAEALNKDRARSERDGDPGKSPEGRVREQLTGIGNQLGRIERDGEAAEPDPVQRAIEAGQAKVAPEYRKALEAYYKEVSK
ncbi:MAG: hypothetical protein L6R28_14910 [Planctomycetes bacterium]|nr:hypothetical protein [Planctomycetota bacterium]